VTSLEPLRFVANASGTVNLCGCKGTDDRPYCDGTHNML
jgi:CDGSH iron-sulfur domain-containing protein 3